MKKSELRSIISDLIEYARHDEGCPKVCGDARPCKCDFEGMLKRAQKAIGIENEGAMKVDTPEKPQTYCDGNVPEIRDKSATRLDITSVDIESVEGFLEPPSMDSMAQIPHTPHKYRSQSIVVEAMRVTRNSASSVVAWVKHLVEASGGVWPELGAMYGTADGVFSISLMIPGQYVHIQEGHWLVCGNVGGTPQYFSTLPPAMMYLLYDLVKEELKGTIETAIQGGSDAYAESTLTEEEQKEREEYFDHLGQQEP